MLRKNTLVMPIISLNSFKTKVVFLSSSVRRETLFRPAVCYLEYLTQGICLRHHVVIFLACASGSLRSF